MAASAAPNLLEPGPRKYVKQGPKVFKNNQKGDCSIYSGVEVVRGLANTVVYSRLPVSRSRTGVIGLGGL